MRFIPQAAFSTYGVTREAINFAFTFSATSGRKLSAGLANFERRRQSSELASARCPQLRHGVPKQYHFTRSGNPQLLRQCIGAQAEWLEIVLSQYFAWVYRPHSIFDLWTPPQSVVINNFNTLRPLVGPHETNPPLVVDTVEAFAARGAVVRSGTARRMIFLPTAPLRTYFQRLSRHRSIGNIGRTYGTTMRQRCWQKYHGTPALARRSKVLWP